MADGREETASTKGFGLTEGSRFAGCACRALHLFAALSYQI